MAGPGRPVTDGSSHPAALTVNVKTDAGPSYVLKISTSKEKDHSRPQTAYWLLLSYSAYAGDYTPSRSFVLE